ncbi:hypothetical protein BT63DRAFT_409081 [Microthyrium microscopicum]|uniref:Zn(2)-C6 fungal-type domain-containing protein n=1 Tax=Microthyrium microscopicum TaxID=703497 RepID=A0A6A6UT46_9PEZI|nr:hypothetical protein BT63DRAFT_409081 [Microthyrium microscopicum]
MASAPDTSPPRHDVETSPNSSSIGQSTPATGSGDSIPSATDGSAHGGRVESASVNSSSNSEFTDSQPPSGEQAHHRVGPERLHHRKPSIGLSCISCQERRQRCTPSKRGCLACERGLKRCIFDGATVSRYQQDDRNTMGDTRRPHETSHASVPTLPGTDGDLEMAYDDNYSSSDTAVPLLPQPPAMTLPPANMLYGPDGVIYEVGNNQAAHSAGWGRFATAGNTCHPVQHPGLDPRMRVPHQPSGQGYSHGPEVEHSRTYLPGYEIVKFSNNVVLGPGPCELDPGAGDERGHRDDAGGHQDDEEDDEGDAQASI